MVVEQHDKLEMFKNGSRLEIKETVIVVLSKIFETPVEGAKRAEEVTKGKDNDGAQRSWDKKRPRLKGTRERLV